MMSIRRTVIIMMSSRWAVLYVSTFVFILPLIFNKEPWSIYFSEFYWPKEKVKQIIVKDNDERLYRARQVFEDKSPRMVVREGGDSTFDVAVDVVIGVITVKRDHDDISTGYLTQVMARLREIIHENTQVFICDTYAGPGLHNEAKQLSMYFKTYNRFPDGSLNHRNISLYIKEKQDYQFCLALAERYNADYTIILQDDALPDKMLFSHLDKVLKRRLPHHENDISHLGFIKLFYPERWQGFGNDYHSLVELAGWGLLSHACFLHIRFFTKCKFSTKSLCLSFFYGVFIALSVGRQFLLELRRLSSDLFIIREAPMCCMPAHLYTKASVSVFARELETRLRKAPESTRPLDIVIDQILQKNKLTALLVEPNLVHHIGFVSTLKGVSKNPKNFLGLHHYS